MNLTSIIKTLYIKATDTLLSLYGIRKYKESNLSVYKEQNVGVPSNRPPIISCGNLSLRQNNVGDFIYISKVELGEVYKEVLRLSSGSLELEKCQYLKQLLSHLHNPD